MNLTFNPWILDFNNLPPGSARYYQAVGNFISIYAMDRYGLSGVDMISSNSHLRINKLTGIHEWARHQFHIFFTYHESPFWGVRIAYHDYPNLTPLQIEINFMDEFTDASIFAYGYLMAKSQAQSISSKY